MKRLSSSFAHLTLLTIGLTFAQGESSQLTVVELPGGSAGIGFDDLQFSPELGKVLVPAGRTGNLILADPETHELMVISGFSAEEQFQGGHGEGTTSADAGQGLLFAIDGTTKRLEVIELHSLAIVAGADLAASPDYVRYMSATKELWVTEPDAEQIEVFSLPTTGGSTPFRTATISVPGGPESLIVDSKRKRAYTHLWNGMTLALDVSSHSIVGRWSNGCSGSRGIALDEQKELLFAGCVEGKATVMDLKHDGKLVDSFSSGAGSDIISYNPSLGHLYLPGGESGTMAIFGVSATGELTLLSTVTTTIGADCVTADNHANAWICDPEHGQLLLHHDTLPPTGRGRHSIRGLCKTGAMPEAASRPSGDLRPAECPQEPACSGDHRSQRLHAVSPQLPPRPQPHRTGLLQTQEPGETM